MLFTQLLPAPTRGWLHHPACDRAVRFFHRNQSRPGRPLLTHRQSQPIGLIRLYRLVDLVNIFSYSSGRSPFFYVD